MADDYLFGGELDQPKESAITILPGGGVAPPISTDNGDHLFGGDLQVAPAEQPKSLYQKWLDNTISGKIAKTIGSAVTLPHDVMTGQAVLPASPEAAGLPGSAQPGQPDSMGRVADLASIIGTGNIPSVTREGLSSIPFLNSGTSPETAALAKTAMDKYGYPVRPGQMSDNWLVHSLDSLLQKIPGSGYAKSADAQQTAINKGVAKLIGQDADRITPDVMSNAKKDLGDTYKQIYGPDVKAPLDEKFSAGILDTLDRAGQVLDDPGQVKVLNKAVSNILDKVKGDGTIAGPAYQGLRQTGSVLKDLEKSPGLLGQYAGEIKGHLDDLFRRTIPPDKANLLQKTDQQYAIMKQLRPLAADATATGGDIAAARLMQLAKTGEAGKERMAFGKGGDLGELAAIGQRFKTMPSSNTAENNMLFKLLGLGGGAGLTAAASIMHDPLTLAGPVAAGAGAAATTRLLGTYMKSPRRAQKLIADALERKGAANGNKLVDTGIAPYLPALQSGSSPQ